MWSEPVIIVSSLFRKAHVQKIMYTLSFGGDNHSKNCWRHYKCQFAAANKKPIKSNLEEIISIVLSLLTSLHRRVGGGRMPCVRREGELSP